MGLNKREQSTYVKIKDGKFYVGKDTENSYDELSGYIKDITFKDEEFDKKVVRKMLIYVESDGERYILSFPFDSSYASSFVSFLKNANLNDELTLIPLFKKEGDKESRSLLLKQNGEYLKSFYTKDNTHGQPAFKKVVKKSGKVEWDKEDFLEFRENVVLNEIKPLLKGISSKSLSAPQEVDLIDTDDATPEETDDLPF